MERMTFKMLSLILYLRKVLTDTMHRLRIQNIVAPVAAHWPVRR
jgi:hypothetical protein